MPMTIVMTRDAPPRTRGFLASCMLEIGPGTYVSPDMSAGVRERVWTVVEDWAYDLGRGSVVMAWPDRTNPLGLSIRTAGLPPYELVDVDGIHLVKREYTDK